MRSPDWVLESGTAGTLFVELVVPFFHFLPRQWRLFVAWITIIWQLLIIATSNHDWLNLLTILLCVLLFDHRAVSRLLPAGLNAGLRTASPFAARPSRPIAVATLVVALVVVPAGLVSATEMVVGSPVPRLSRLNDRVDPFRIANRYHVFPTMDSDRYAVQIEGTLDGDTWEPIDFRYAPDNIGQRPRFIVPHQPRIDWLIWFVPRGPVFLDWFDRFLHCVVEGSPAVLALLDGPKPRARPNLALPFRDARGASRARRLVDAQRRWPLLSASRPKR